MQKIIIALLLPVLFGCTENNENEEKNYGNNSSTGRYYDIRGFKMYVETYGEGEPLLFIHGNGGSIRHFVNQIPYFSKRYRVIVADSRAQGRSADTQDSLSYEMMADDFNALLDTLRVDSAYVLGWSDGGINALLLAGRHPGKVKKLASAGANLWPDSSALTKDFLDMMMPDYTRLKNIAEKPDSIRQQWKLTRLMVEQPHIPLASLNSIKCPALIISGDHDVIQPGHTMLIYQNIPKAYLWILPGSGHAPLFSRKEEFNKTVDDFFSQPYREITGEARFH